MKGGDGEVSEGWRRLRNKLRMLSLVMRLCCDATSPNPHFASQPCNRRARTGIFGLGKSGRHGQNDARVWAWHGPSFKLDPLKETTPPWSPPLTPLTTNRLYWEQNLRHQGQINHHKVKSRLMHISMQQVIRLSKKSTKVKGPMNMFF